MSISSLPTECLSNILYFLDNQLYNCLLVNRYWCSLIVPMIWREPFVDNLGYICSYKVIDSLLACLDVDEISSLIPCSIIFNYQTPLFEYGKYVKRIKHEIVADNIIIWLSERESTEVIDDVDCRIEKLVDVIYHVIMRQGSNIRGLDLMLDKGLCVDLPKFIINNTFTNYVPGIMCLRYLRVGSVCVMYQNIIEFLITVSRFCNSISTFYLTISDVIIDQAFDIIKLQPLRCVSLRVDDFHNITVQDNIKKIVYALEYRSNTLKELSIMGLDVQDFDLSFISKLDLDRLDLMCCKGFNSRHLYTLSKTKLHPKRLTLFLDDIITLNVMKAMVNSFCSRTLLQLTINFMTLDIVKAIKESCPNIRYLDVTFCSEKFLDSIIPIICELSTLETLKIDIGFGFDENDIDLLVKPLGEYLIYVKYLVLTFYIDLPSFKRFTSKCKSNLKKCIFLVDKKNSIKMKDYLECVENFQKKHNSLNALGINNGFDGNWTDEELLKIVNSLKSQGVNVVSACELLLQIELISPHLNRGVSC